MDIDRNEDFDEYTPRIPIPECRNWETQHLRLTVPHIRGAVLREDSSQQKVVVRPCPNLGIDRSIPRNGMISKLVLKRPEVIESTNRRVFRKIMIDGDIVHQQRCE